MTGPLIDQNPMFADRPLPLDRVVLSPQHISQAEQHSTAAASEAQQWQTYLNWLALFGLEQWLQERSPDLLSLSNFRLSTDITLPQLQIGAFKLHLIAVEDVRDYGIPIPRVAIDPPTVHFFLLIEVLEELGQIWICGYLRHDELRQLRRQSTLPQEGNADLVPLDWFQPDPDTLLLYLRCLDPSAIPLPAAASLTQRALTQRAINVGLWLQEQLDSVAQELSWVLLPPLTVGAMRSVLSTSQEFEAMLAEVVEQQAITLPPNARAAYQDLDWENLPLRLYATIWPLPNHTATSEPEWTLLLLLGTRSGTALPIGTRLQVRDATQLLEEAVLQESAQGYLYAQVIGILNEAFWVTVTLPNGKAITLCPFMFSRGELL